MDRIEKKTEKFQQFTMIRGTTKNGNDAQRLTLLFEFSLEKKKCLAFRVTTVGSIVAVSKVSARKH